MTVNPGCYIVTQLYVAGYTLLILIVKSSRGPVAEESKRLEDRSFYLVA